MKSFIFAVAMMSTLPTFAWAASETVEGARKDYANFKKDMSIQLQQLDQKIDGLKKQAHEKGESAQNDSIETLEKTKKSLQVQLDELQKAGESTWSRAKKKFAESVDDLNTRVQKSVGK